MKYAGVTLQKDNSTFPQKRADRIEALKWLAEPSRILEAYGGYGVLFRACYVGSKRGLVFEREERKANALARQRPTWAVYRCDAAVGVGAVWLDVPFNLIDVDPYGSAWVFLDAYFAAERVRPDRMVLVVNDGMRHHLNIGAWDVYSLRGVVKRYGNKLHAIWLEVCKEMLTEKADGIGFDVARFGGYYCGAGHAMTHWVALLTKRGAVSAPGN